MNSDNPGDIEDKVNKRVQEEEASLPPGKEEDAPEIASAFVDSCLASNYRGIGILFSAINRDRFIFNKSTGEWLAWKGHHWAKAGKPGETESVFTGVEDVAISLTKRAGEIQGEISKESKTDPDDPEAEPDTGKVKRLRGKQTALNKMARSLRDEKSKNCLEWAGDRLDEGLGIMGDKIDTNPWLLACNNGVIDLRTGEHRPGRHSDYLLKAVPHDWKGLDEPSPIWDETINKIFDRDRSIIDYVLRLLGYGITGLTTEHVFPLLHGEGRNGKTTLVETVSHVMGPLAESVPTELFIEQKFARTSSGATPDIMMLPGLRLGFASETGEHQRLSADRIKKLTGGDRISGRDLYQKDIFHFDPTHLLFMLTNVFPYAPGWDFALWERVHVIPFDVKFTNNPTGDKQYLKDKDLGKKLKAEASGILASLVKGCLAWQRDGLNPPKKITEATEKYRINEDVMDQFINDRLKPLADTDPVSKSLFADIYKEFADWYSEEKSEDVPSKIKFGRQIERKVEKKKEGSTTYLYGIELKPVEV